MAWQKNFVNMRVTLCALFYMKIEEMKNIKIAGEENINEKSYKNFFGIVEIIR